MILVKGWFPGGRQGMQLVREQGDEGGVKVTGM